MLRLKGESGLSGRSDLLQSRVSHGCGGREASGEELTFLLPGSSAVVSPRKGRGAPDGMRFSCD